MSSHYRLRVAAGLTRSDQLVVRGIASRDRARADTAAAEMGISQGYGSYQELLDDPEIEAVYIPLPNHLHLEWIKRAADAGKHVLCEKPLGLDAAQVQEAIDYTAAKGVLLMEAFMYRFHPQWRHARELVAIGEVGTPTAVHCSFFYNNRDPQNIRNRVETGGGALMDIGCYAVSSARFLLGREPDRVVGLLQRDEQFGTDRLSSGMSSILAMLQAVFSVGTQTGAAQSVQLFGTGGNLRVELPFNAYTDVPLSVHVRSGIGPREVTVGPADQYRLQFEAFSQAVRGESSVLIPPEDAYNNQRVLDALFASGRSGHWEKL